MTGKNDKNEITDITPEMAKLGYSMMQAVNNPKVEVRDAGVKGRGVFAKQDIPKGEALCFYDGDDREMDRNIKYPEKYYMVALPNRPGRKGWARYGYSEPKSKIGIGQLVNDGYMIDFGFDRQVVDFREEFKEGRRKIKRYERKQKRKVNIIMHVNMWFYALKDIKKDEELLWTYGASYWLVQAFDRANTPKKKVLLRKIMKLRPDTIVSK